MPSSSPTPASHLLIKAGLFIAVVAAGLYIGTRRAPGPQAAAASPEEPLVVYCAASLRVPVEALAKDYQARYQVQTSIQFGGSQTLLSNIDVTKKGDLFLPADDSYFAMAKAKGLLASTLPIAAQSAVVMTAKGNPKKIKDLSDLLRSDVRLAISNPDAAAIGKLLRDKLGSDYWQALSKKAVLTAATVTEAANAVKADGADAAFIWNSMARQYPDNTLVELPEITGVTAQVGVGLLTCSKQDAAAMKFAQFLSAKETGVPVFKREGFEAVTSGQ